MSQSLLSEKVERGEGEGEKETLCVFKELYITTFSQPSSEVLIWVWYVKDHMKSLRKL